MQNHNTLAPESAPTPGAPAPSYSYVATPNGVADPALVTPAELEAALATPGIVRVVIDPATDAAPRAIPTPLLLDALAGNRLALALLTIGFCARSKGVDGFDFAVNERDIAKTRAAFDTIAEELPALAANFNQLFKGYLAYLDEQEALEASAEVAA